MRIEGVRAEIDAIRYGAKLASLLTHVHTILRFCTNPKYQDYFKATFRVRTVPNPSIVSSPTGINGWQKAELAAFLRSVCLERTLRNRPETVDEAIDRLSGIAVDNLEKSPVYISGPHCECLLVQHYHQEARGEPVMATYIATSSLSCLQCGLFLDAYNQTVPNGPLFFIRGRDKSDICSYVVPPIDAATDPPIAEKMRVRLNDLIGKVIYTSMLCTREPTTFYTL